jgi:predicted nucleic acid-binding Zn ribbon protein
MDNRFDAAFAEAERLFDHLLAVFGGPKRSRRGRLADQPGTQAFEAGRDPRSLASLVQRQVDENGWGPQLARASIVADWVDVVGPEVAAHATPQLDETVLTILCDSSAWATQLRILRHDILNTIHDRYDETGIEQIHVLGPGVPEQIRGPRRVKWRGPRDTYG